MLLYLEEKSHKEIAEIIGISETNVATKIGRIKILKTQKLSNFGNHMTKSWKKTCYSTGKMQKISPK